MKKVFFLIMFITGGISSQAAIILHTDIYKADLKQCRLLWFAEKVTGKHNGTIEISGGEIANEHGNISGNFEFDMSAIKDSDIEDEKSRAKLENHLKSPDFFDVAKYPTAKFIITSITPIEGSKPGEETHIAKGNLTIKDKTNEISFPVMMNMGPEQVTVTGSATVDRSKYDVRYGSKTFFNDIGDKMIYDDFILKFTIIAKKN